LELLLSKSSMPLIKYIAQLLGWLMNGIYFVLDKIGIPNIGLCIIFFTIIIYLCLTPVQIKQQKSSKVMNAIQPELLKLQKKYQGKTDAASQQKMQEETMALYGKYGVSPTGSCLPLLIQMPILFGLYQVILYIPGYVSKVANIFHDLAYKVTQVSGYQDILTTFVADNKIRVYGKGDYALNRVIDMMYVLKPSQWTKLENISQFSSLKADMIHVASQSARINNFLGINISQSPWDAIKTGFSSIVGGTATVAIVGALIAGILVPVLAWFTQWLTMKLMPQQSAGDDSMTRQMNSMNAIMPIFSAVFCVTLSMGIGIYWIAGAVIRAIQQVVINRRIGKIDVEDMIEAQARKNEKKQEKSKDYVSNVTQNARTNVKHIQNAKSNGKDIDSSQFYREEEDLKPDSITAKANWVKSYDEKKGNRRK